MTNLELIMEQYPEDEFLKADGYDEAIIGTYQGRLVYSIKKCIEILELNMEHEEAVEYFFFNTEGAYMGELTPVWVEDRMLDPLLNL